MEPKKVVRALRQIFVDGKTGLVKKILGVEEVPTAQQVGRYIKAKVSPPATPEVFEGRMAECLACPKLVEKNDQKFCGGGCGCGTRPEAELNVKLAFGFAHCPLERPYFSNNKGETSE